MRHLLRRVFGHRRPARQLPSVEPPPPVHAPPVLTPTPEMWDALLTLARHHRAERAFGGKERRPRWVG